MTFGVEVSGRAGDLHRARREAYQGVGRARVVDAVRVGSFQLSLLPIDRLDRDIPCPAGSPVKCSSASMERSPR
jgi:hypothetical protein